MIFAPRWLPASWAVAFLIALSPLQAQTTAYSSAKGMGSALCGGGSFFDPINGGSCWSCPDGTRRTVFPVNQAKACESPGGQTFSRASDRGAPTSASPFLPKTQCPGGAFLDVGRGRCYSCPSGAKRTLEAVTSERACVSSTQASFQSARNAGKAGCAAGSFFDPINGGTCWACPSGSKRTAFPVNGDKACESPPARSTDQARYDDLYRAALAHWFISDLANGQRLKQSGVAMVPGSTYAIGASDIDSHQGNSGASAAALFGAGSSLPSLRGKVYYRWPLAFKKFHSQFLEGLTFAVMTDDQQVMVLFYGTNMSFTEKDPARPGNLIYDIANPPLPSPVYDGNVVFPAFAGLADEIYREIKPLLVNEYGIRNKQVIVTGHSLGGAVAGYVTYLMAKDRLFRPSPAAGGAASHRLVTLGAPRYAFAGLNASLLRNLGTTPLTADTLEIEEDPTPLAFTALGIQDLNAPIGQVFRISANRLSNPRGKDDFLKYHNGNNYIQFALRLKNGAFR